MAGKVPSIVTAIGQTLTARILYECHCKGEKGYLESIHKGSKRASSDGLVRLRRTPHQALDAASPMRYALRANASYKKCNLYNDPTYCRLADSKR
jgi:hypothetical protein